MYLGRGVNVTLSYGSPEIVLAAERGETKFVSD